MTRLTCKTTSTYPRTFLWHMKAFATRLTRLRTNFVRLSRASASTVFLTKAIWTKTFARSISTMQNRCNLESTLTSAFSSMRTAYSTLPSSSSAQAVTTRTTKRQVAVFSSRTVLMLGTRVQWVAAACPTAWLRNSTIHPSGLAQIKCHWSLSRHQKCPSIYSNSLQACKKTTRLVTVSHSRASMCLELRAKRVRSLCKGG